MTLSSEFLTRLKEALPLSSLVSESVKLTHRGKVYKGLCPFHPDQNPSLDVDDSKGRYRCWVCGATGDIISWQVAITKETDFYSVVKSLAAQVNIEMPKPESTNDEHRAVIRCLYKAKGFYSTGLKKNAEARAYLNERGISEESIHQWELGAVSSGIVNLLLHNVDRETVRKSGIAAEGRNGQLYDRLRQRIIIPLHSKTGKILGFSGRKIHQWDETPKYLNPPDTELFSKGDLLFGLDKALPQIYKTGTMVIVEGYFDVIALHQAGEKRAVAGMGTAITINQLNIMCKLAKEIIFCFDHDKGGSNAIRQLLPKLLNVINDKSVIRFNFIEKGLDPDEYIRKYGIRSWLDSCKDSAYLSAILMSYITSNYQLSSFEDKQKAALRGLEVCNSIKNAILLKQLLIDEVKNKIGVDLTL